MTIDEAIDRDVELRGELIREGRLEMAGAVSMGIEALKRIKGQRYALPPRSIFLLPGETEE